MRVRAFVNITLNLFCLGWAFRAMFPDARLFYEHGPTSRTLILDLAESAIFSGVVLYILHKHLSIIDGPSLAISVPALLLSFVIILQYFPSPGVMLIGAIYPSIWLSFRLSETIRENRMFRRQKAGLCRFCGYDCRESASRCPECGISFERVEVGEEKSPESAGSHQISTDLDEKHHSG